MEEEQWSPVVIDGLLYNYQVSNLGRIKRNDGYILKPTKRKDGYMCVTLRRNEKKKTMLVHRLVISAFIPNPNNLPQVNHKDEDKTNNRLDNLEWCTNKYNANYGTKVQRQMEKVTGQKRSEEFKKKRRQYMKNIPEEHKKHIKEAKNKRKKEVK